MSNSLLEIIDANEKFCGDVHKFLDDTNSTNLGTDYHIVSVLGSQSTGKSTLLNHLFGTEFPVLASGGGRQRTTEGIWLGRATKSPVLVFDVEGTDSAQRGEDHAKFERKSALFSLAVSEVLIINMFQADIGRYEGSNASLLKTVFEVHLSLFQQESSPRTLLLFIIRDHDEAEYPLAKLEESLLLHKIWESVHKPEKFQNSSITDFFDLQFIGLSHFRYLRSKFDQQISNLKLKFGISPQSTAPTLTRASSSTATDDTPAPQNDTIDHSGRPSSTDAEPSPKDESYFLAEYVKNIPIDGFPHYTQSLWSKILENKDLDIPSQQEMLSVYRCDEILTKCSTSFNAATDPLIARLKDIAKNNPAPTPTTDDDSESHFNSPIPNLVTILKNLFISCTEDYLNIAHRYIKSIVVEKLQDLHKILFNRIFSLFSLSSDIEQSHFIDLLQANLVSSLDSSYVSPTDYIKIIHTSKESVSNSFKTSISKYNLALPVEILNFPIVTLEYVWDVDSVLHDFNSSIKDILETTLANQCEKMFNHSCDELRNNISSPLRKACKTAKPSFWADVRSLHKSQFDPIYNNLLSGFETLGIKPTVSEKYGQKITSSTSEYIQTTIQEFALHIFPTLKTQFDNHFCRETDGSIKLWSSANATQMPTIFAFSKSAAFKTLNMFTVFRFDQSVDDIMMKAISTHEESCTTSDSTSSITLITNIPSSVKQFIIIPEHSLENIALRLISETDAAMMNAKITIQNQNKIAKIPPIFWIILILFGFNEIKDLVSNPFWFILVGLIAGAAFFLYSTGSWRMIPQLSAIVNHPYVDNLWKTMWGDGDWDAVYRDVPIFGSGSGAGTADTDTSGSSNQPLNETGSSVKKPSEKKNQ